MKSILLFLIVSTATLAQPVSVGVKAGVPMNGLLDTVSAARTTVNSLTNPYIVGPSVELRLPAGFGIEFNALYRRFSYNASLIDTLTNLNTAGNNWEFPLMVKKRFTGGHARPFLAAGINFNKVTGVTQTVGSLVNNAVSSNSNPPELKNDVVKGAVIGAGIELHALFLKITPEIRYTRWGSTNFSGFFTPGGLITSNKNQAEFLLGFSF